MGESKLILIIMAGESAENASFSLAKMLEDKGHRVIFLAPYWRREYIESQGFPFHTFPLPEANREHGQANTWWNPLKNYRNNLYRLLADREYVSDCAEKWFDETKPDLALLDAKMLEYTIPLLRKKIPIINLNANMSSFYTEGRPPIYSSLYPQQHLSATFRSNIAWYKLFLAQHVKAIKENPGIFAGRTINRFRATRSLVKDLGAQIARTEYGLRLIAPEIVLGPKCFDFPAKTPTTIRCYAGISVYEDRKDCAFDLTSLHPDKPLIYCSLGTHSEAYAHAMNLLQCLTGCMKELPEYQLVLQTDLLGQHNDRLPSNVKICPRVPQLELLKRARLFITHGGFSSIRESILTGTPMIVFPGWHDQPGNAARVMYHGIGRRGDMKKITRPELVSMIREVLNNTSMLQNIKKMREAIISQNESRRAIQLIESYF